MSRGALAVICLAIAGCGGGSGLPGVPVDLGRSGGEGVLRFYLGSYVDPSIVDSVLIADGSSFRVDLDALDTIAPTLHRALSEAADDGVVDRDELQEVVQRTYFDARPFSRTAAELAGSLGYSTDDPEWLSVGVRGSMTPYERRVFIPVRAVESALRSYVGASGKLVYPVGTTVVGEHLEEGRVVETTAMIRRADGYWDFVAYDASGALLRRIDGDPDPLDVPTQCFGCHYGNRLFEPERSFPAQPPDGPHGPRRIDAREAWTRADVVTVLDEHRRRDDGLLGIYGTLLVGRWMDERSTGSLSTARAEILDALGL